VRLITEDVDAYDGPMDHNDFLSISQYKVESRKEEYIIPDIVCRERLPLVNRE
jgi:hypothetical protein